MTPVSSTILQKPGGGAQGSPAPSPAAPREQRTLARTALLAGVGLHTGAEVHLELRPAGPDSGVVFVRTDLTGKPRVEASLANVASRPRRTALARGEAEVHTTEHLLAALSATGVQNLEVHLDAPELPGLDGSALQFLEGIHSAGTQALGVPLRRCVPARAVHAIGRDAWVAALPRSQGGLKLCYTLDYRALASALGASSEVLALSTSYFEIEVTEESFARELAPARTFVFEDEVRRLRAEGLGRGANPRNTLVLGREGVLENELRFPDELARHKVLDLLGDLFLLGATLDAQCVAARSGHSLNVELARALSAADGAGAPPPFPVGGPSR